MAEFYLRPLPGSDALTKFIKVCTEAMPNTRFESLSIHTNIQSPHLQLGAGTPQEWAKQSAALAEILKKKAYCKCTKIIAVNNNARVEYSVEANELAAKIAFTNANTLNPGIGPVALADAFHQEFNFTGPEELFLKALPEVQQQQLRVYERAISDLTAQAARMHELAGKIAAEHADHFRKRSEQMDSEHAEKRRLLEEQKERDAQELKAREAAFNKKVEEFEMREGTAVRRDLAKKLRDEIAGAPAVKISAYPRSQRYIVHIICLPVLALLATGIALGVTRLFSTTVQIGDYLPIIGMSMFFAILLWFYLRFNYIWADRLAQAELTTQKYARDFKRADWLTELINEYSSERKGAFPPEVAARLAQNIFTDVQWSRQNVHPGDDVVDFLSRVSKFKSNREGVEIELADHADDKK